MFAGASRWRSMSHSRLLRSLNARSARRNSPTGAKVSIHKRCSLVRMDRSAHTLSSGSPTKAGHND